jgi:hypothetical protein
MNFLRISALIVIFSLMGSSLDAMKNDNTLTNRKKEKIARREMHACSQEEKRDEYEEPNSCQTCIAYVGFVASALYVYKEILVYQPNPSYY